MTGSYFDAEINTSLQKQVERNSSIQLFSNDPILELNQTSRFGMNNSDE